MHPGKGKAQTFGAGQDLPQRSVSVIVKPCRAAAGPRGGGRLLLGQLAVTPGLERSQVLQVQGVSALSHCCPMPSDNLLMICRLWTLAEGNADRWQTPDQALPSDSSYREDLRCLLKDPPCWQTAQVTICNKLRFTVSCQPSPYLSAASFCC